jgi:hypothetical protein
MGADATSATLQLGSRIKWWSNCGYSGHFLVLVDGAEVPATVFGGRKVRVPVAGACGPPQCLPRDAAAKLGVLVNRARRALGDPAAVRTGDGGYALGARVVVDVEVFLTALAAAREAATNRQASARRVGLPRSLSVRRGPRRGVGGISRRPGVLFPG